MPSRRGSIRGACRLSRRVSTLETQDQRDCQAPNLLKCALCPRTNKYYLSLADLMLNLCLQVLQLFFPVSTLRLARVQRVSNEFIGSAWPSWYAFKSYQRSCAKCPHAHQTLTRGVGEALSKWSRMPIAKCEPMLLQSTTGFFDAEICRD